MGDNIHARIRNFYTKSTYPEVFFQESILLYQYFVLKCIFLEFDTF